MTDDRQLFQTLKLKMNFDIEHQLNYLEKNLENDRNSRSQMFFKIGVFKKLRNTHRKTLVLESLFNKVGGLQLY